MPIPKPGEEPKPGEKPKPGPRPKIEPIPKPGKQPSPDTFAPLPKSLAADEPADKPKAEEESQPKEQAKSREQPEEESQPKSKDQSKPPPPKPKIEPHRIVPMRMEAPMPEIAKKHFEAKRGYANYYFNRLHQDRVLKAWRGGCDLTDLGGKWTLSGQREGGGKFSLELTDAGGILKLPTSEIAWEAGENLAASLAPPQSGGLLPALYVFRRLAVEGPSKFDEVYYVGTAPLAGQPALVDVLAVLHKGVDCRLFFDPAEGRLLAMELFADEDEDPCEIYFSEYRQVEGRSLPGKMEVRVGDEPYAVLPLSEFSFEKAPEKQPSKPDEGKP